jgi:hypothetical protein
MLDTVCKCPLVPDFTQVDTGTWADTEFEQAASTTKNRKQQHAASAQRGNQARTEVWHRRLAHASYEVLASAAKHDMLHGFTATPADFTDHHRMDCTACNTGRHVRSPFPASQTRTVRPMQQVSSNVCTPMRAQGQRYFLTEVDRHTNYTE